MVSFNHPINNPMSDFLHRGIIKDFNTRFVHGVCTDLANEAVLRHNCDPPSAHILARALGAGSLLIPLLNPDEVYTLRWRYNGALRNVIVDARGDGSLRGFADPAQIGGIVKEEREIYGNGGSLAVIKANNEGPLNSGTTEAGLLDVVDDLSLFFSVSDQVETAMLVLVGFRADPKRPVALCQGIMLQALPGCDLEKFESLRQRMGSEACRNLLAEAPNREKPFAAIAQALADTVTPPAFSLETTPQPVFRCNCDRERMLNVLKTLDTKELKEICKQERPLTVACQFCSTRHEFTANDIRKIIE